MTVAIDHPDHVQIGPFNFKILWDAKAMKKASRIDGVDKFGMTSVDDIEIVCDPDRPLIAKQVTLTHEILHAILWVWNISTPFPKDAESDPDDREEVFVACFDAPLLDVLHRNPHVVQFLTAKE